MKGSLVILTTMAIIIAAVPHLTCGCGCSALWQADRGAQQSNGCPHCEKGIPEASPDAPQPCKCDDCKKLFAATPGPATPAVLLSHNTCVDTLVDVESLWITEPNITSDSKSRAPPGDSSHSSAALPILLGHLLF